MATHSSVLAWRIPGMGEPRGLLSIGSHRVGYNWSNLAAACLTLLPPSLTVDHDFRKPTLLFSLSPTCRCFSCSMPCSLQCFKGSNEQQRKLWWPRTICGRNRGADPVRMWQVHQRVCSHSQRGAPWTPWNRCLIPRGQVCSLYPTFPKPERIQSPKFILLLPKNVHWPPEDATTLKHEMQRLGFTHCPQQDRVSSPTASIDEFTTALILSLQELSTQYDSPLFSTDSSPCSWPCPQMTTEVSCCRESTPGSEGTTVLNRPMKDKRRRI